MGLTVDEIVPDSIELTINEGEMRYDEEYEPDDKDAAIRVANMTSDVMDSYADYIEEVGYDDVVVHNKVYESDGTVHAHVGLELDGSDMPNTIQFAIAATELMSLLSLRDKEMWSLVADVTSPSDTDIFGPFGDTEY